MAIDKNNTANVSVGKGVKGGYLFSAPIGTMLPTAYDTTAEDLDPAFDNLGYITEDGINNAIEVDSENFVDMNGDTIESAGSTYTETLVFTLAEQRRSSLALEYGEDNVEDVDGQITARHRSDAKEHHVLVALLVLKDGRRQTSVIPDGQVTEVGEKQYLSTELVGRELTVTCFPNGDGDHIIDYIESTETQLTSVHVGETAFINSALAAKKELKRITGKDEEVDSDEVFIIELKGPVTGKFIFSTVEVKGKKYGVMSGSKGVPEGTKAIFFSLKSGKQVDFLDGDVSTEELKKCDLSDFSGDITLTVYETSKQTDSVYPTGLMQISKRTITIDNAQE